MLNKVSAVARIVGLLLAIVAGFMPGLGFDIALVLVVLGLVAGISMPAENIMRVGVFVLVASSIGAALAHLPAIGTQLGGVFGALGLRGHVRPASSNRRSISRTVERETPVRRATSLTVRPASRTSLSISRTWRIATLSVGIGLSQKERP